MIDPSQHAMFEMVQPAMDYATQKPPQQEEAQKEQVNTAKTDTREVSDAPAQKFETTQITSSKSEIQLHKTDYTNQPMEHEATLEGQEETQIDTYV
ncbi:MAG: hypothetical protein P9L92_15175 [Candidatus Electryonea clarkiae]|nr:hypothetical protein [Candidatus Electryonea clarkiae]MDP8287522.1 hypothetical protein [Candidatus Electryonea clarkiae]